mgnify:CR=1 FL=1
MTEELEEYILRHIDKEGETLSRLDRETHLYHLRPRMCSGHLQGKLLKMFVRMIRPKRILELGTFTGYSALAMAEGLVPGAELHTIEIDDELEDFIREHFCQAQQGKNIHLHIGDARDIIPQVGGKFDLVFMDANKRQYLEYYNLVFDYVTPTGSLLPTTRCGTEKWSTTERNSTLRQREYLSSTILLLPTSVWKRL